MPMIGIDPAISGRVEKIHLIGSRHEVPDAINGTAWHCLGLRERSVSVS
jgi:hypothetical protein